jgi:hypothetical protein
MVKENKNGKYKEIPILILLFMVGRWIIFSILKKKYFSGENLDGSQLSFTTHSKSCQWERKNKIYKLKVNQFDPHERMSERAYITLNLPYYNSTLYMCLTPANSNEVFHQGNR